MGGEIEGGFTFSFNLNTIMSGVLCPILFALCFFVIVLCVVVVLTISRFSF